MRKLVSNAIIIINRGCVEFDTPSCFIAYLLFVYGEPPCDL